MDEESGGLHIIFICILAGILLLTYSLVPSDPTEKENVKISSQTKTKTNHAAEETKSDEMDEHAASPEAEDEEPVDKEDALVQEDSKASSETPADSDTDGFAIIAMNNPAYETHKKGIVQFTHQKHIDDYKIDCGRCHHDENGEPLELSKGDPVDSCADCHTETEKERGEDLDDKEKIAKYHFEALHANCIGCHKTFNIENGDPKGRGPAPTSCSKCHPKK